jgi:membrane protein DedA with SNARE-associated domain
MDFAIAILLLTLGVVFGALAAYAILRDKRSLLDQFNEIHNSPENVEQRARRVQ